MKIGGEKCTPWWLCPKLHIRMLFRPYIFFIMYDMKTQLCAVNILYQEENCGIKIRNTTSA